MSDEPVSHVLAGPNGSGKSSFVVEKLGPSTGLPFINADVIAAREWPGDEEAHAYEASRAAAWKRDQAIAKQESFITETVFSHESKLELVQQAIDAGYHVALHVMLIPEELAVIRVAYRVSEGGHTVPEEKIRARYRRLWRLVARARAIAHRTTFYDNSKREDFRRVAVFEWGKPVGTPVWPAWTPAELTA